MRGSAKILGVALLLAGLLFGGPGLRAQVGETPNPGDISLPEGYEIEVVATGLNSPTALAISADGEIFVAESGFLPGGLARILKVNPDGMITQLAPAAGFTFKPPLLGLAVGPDGTLYAGDKGRILRVEPDGSLMPVSRASRASATTPTITWWLALTGSSTSARGRRPTPASSA
ncbi:MAG: hypothetical protein ACE5LQ_01500 [Candidatus Bipolaricaulia bacterium]